MEVLVTGGAGFIAHHLAAALLRRGDKVALVDNFNDYYDPEIKRRNVRDLEAIGAEAGADVRCHALDILDKASLRRVFEASPPEAVVHLAAWAGVRPSLEKPAVYTEVNVTGTVNLLELAKEFGANCFVFGSSSSVYGGSGRVPFAEDDPVARPISPYAATKRAGELLCHSYAHNFGMHVTCLRFFTVYGPRQRPDLAIHKFARLMDEGRDVPLFGKGDSRRDYTYVGDIVSGVLAAMEKNFPFEIFNLGESQTVSLLELVASLEEALGKKARVKWLPEQTGDMKVTYADISKSRRLLGYDPRTPFREGIRLFTDWFRGGR
ncbi:MAG: GDP-mannose 4,6-dehydratase [Acidobacteriota bacterium]|jgi:UDP-glucuronate 4-epimerase|nr:GDP-mannose 4,6-dehydratase [Acidobacteriota bacterium]